MREALKDLQTVRSVFFKVVTHYLVEYSLDFCRRRGARTARHAHWGARTVTGPPGAAYDPELASLGGSAADRRAGWLLASRRGGVRRQLARRIHDGAFQLQAFRLAAQRTDISLGGGVVVAIAP